MTSKYSLLSLIDMSKRITSRNRVVAPSEKQATMEQESLASEAGLLRSGLTPPSVSCVNKISIFPNLFSHFHNE